MKRPGLSLVLFLFIALLLVVSTSQGKRTSQKFTLKESLIIKNEGPGMAFEIKVWLALIQDLPPYQRVISKDITPASYTIVSDENQNKYAQFGFSEVQRGKEIPIEMKYEIEVNEFRAALDNCRWGSMPDSAKPFLKAERLIESDHPKIECLARTLVKDSKSPCEGLKKIYKWIGENIEYSTNVFENKGALWAIQNKEGDCFEFSSLFVALSRAAGIPARIIQGLVYKADYRNEEELLHAWTEAYLPGVGWVPIDPTWGRYAETSEDYFAKITPDHVVITCGGNSPDHSGENSMLRYQWWWDDMRASISWVDWEWFIEPA